MVSRLLCAGLMVGAATAALGFVVYSAYNRDIRAARKRIKHGKLISTRHGQIEYADVGHGITTTVLAIHGAGGGFDQHLHIVLENDVYR